MTYTPVLKAKFGELQAFSELDPAVRAAIRPVFELCPDNDPDVAIERAVRLLTRRVPAGTEVGIAAHLVDPLRPVGSSATTIEHVANALNAAGLVPLPVVRVADTAALRAAHANIGAATGADVILRLGDDNYDPPPSLPAGLLAGLLSDIGIPRSQVHLLLDMREVASIRDLGRAENAAATTLAWADSVGGWASTTVAAGSFPTQISDLPTGTSTQVRRFDADLYRRLVTTHTRVEFGDYVVNHPVLPRSAGRGPLPNMRYTAGRSWQVWREPKNRPGNESFYDLAANLVADPAYAGDTFSWGDRELARAAREVRGAGQATQWRAFATNHHVTTVVDRLATLGEP